MSRRSNSIRIALVAASALALVTACSAPAADPHAAHAAQAASADVVVQPTAAASGRVSIYDLRGEWTDQAGRTARLGEMPRRPLTVVTMLYTNCTVSCPRILVDLKRIEAGLPADRLDDVRFVIASIDPARDTPVRLAGWAQDVRLDTARFTLITAPDATVRELAAALRVRYLSEPNGEFGHSNRIVVLDADGAIIHWQAGLGAGADETIALLASAGRQPGTSAGH
ncbi:MAG TPA: SCO family protein [Gemmatimonadaceae bacterium]|nr:SCO family protein [Gemmatimonadaceae bacterium]